MFQNLSTFQLPPGFRGRSAAVVQLWWTVQSTIFRSSPRLANGYRAWLLRKFGATVGKQTLIRPSVTITYPWKVTIGDHAWIGDDAVLYSLGEITIGNHAVVSQHSYLCAGDHDYRRRDFPIRSRPITIGDEAWIGADVFVGPGVSIGRGSVVGARSSVFRDLPEGMVCVGNPCEPVKRRTMED